MTHTAFFPGSFNPFTIGHADIVERALKMFDSVVIGVGFNISKDCDDKARTEAEGRMAHINSLYSRETRVSAIVYCGLTVDAAEEAGACVMIRGLRNASDFEYEKNLADVNAELSDIPTVFIPCRPALAHVSSSMVRELQAFGYPVDRFLPGEE